MINHMPMTDQSRSHCMQDALHATSPSVWLPYSTLDHLHQALQSAPTNSRLSEVGLLVIDTSAQFVILSLSHTHTRTHTRTCTRTRTHTRTHIHTHTQLSDQFNSRFEKYFQQVGRVSQTIKQEAWHRSAPSPSGDVSHSGGSPAWSSGSSGSEDDDDDDGTTY